MQNFLKEISKKVLTLRVSTSYMPIKQEFHAEKPIVTCRETNSYIPTNY